MQPKASQQSERTQLPESYDELYVRNNEMLQKLIPSDEKIYFSGKIIKINHRSVPQQRILIITDKALYNIHPKNSLVSKIAYFLMPAFQVKRRVPIEKIEATTISTHPLSDQFVLHIKGEFDFLFDGVGKRERIIKALTQVQYDLHNDYLTFYLKDEFNLAIFHTTKSDLNNGFIKKPTEGHLQVSPKLLWMGLNWIIENQDNLIKHPKLQQWISDSLANSSNSSDSLLESQIPGSSETMNLNIQLLAEPYEHKPSKGLKNKQFQTLEDLMLSSESKGLPAQPRRFTSPQSLIKDHHDVINQVLSGNKKTRD